MGDVCNGAVTLFSVSEVFSLEEIKLFQTHSLVRIAVLGYRFGTAAK